MDLNKNYYAILNVDKRTEDEAIKKVYYKLSRLVHPDRNNTDGAKEQFQLLSEAYTVLSDKRTEYDKKSKYGRNYNEIEELLKIDMNFDHLSSRKGFDKAKDRYVLDIFIEIEETHTGNIEYERWVKCNGCDGSGYDNNTKIMIKNQIDGTVRYFDAVDGCDFCEGSGKDYMGNECYFCNGKGKSGLNRCSKCEGEKRIKGKQTLKNVKIDNTEVKVESMGHVGRGGKVGNLFVKRKI